MAARKKIETAPKSLEARTREAEAAWKRAHPNAARSLPRAEIFDARKRTTDAEKLRHARPGRYNPARFDPAPVAYVEREGEGELTFIEHPSDPDFIGDRTTWLTRQGAGPDREYVSRDLARKAQALRSIFDIQPRVDVAFQNTFVHPQVREAIEAASAALDTIWIGFLLDLVAQAVRRALEHEASKRLYPAGGAKRITAESAERALALRGATMLPEHILAKLHEGLEPFEGVVAVPAYVTAAVVQWLAARYGEGRGGGRPGATRKTKLSRAKLADLLGKEGALSAAMRRG